VAVWQVWLAAAAMFFLVAINVVVLKYQPSYKNLPVENVYQLSVIHTY
jgi:hypothetical protein